MKYLKLYGVATVNYHLHCSKFTTTHLTFTLVGPGTQLCTPNTHLLTTPLLKRNWRQVRGLTALTAIPADPARLSPTHPTAHLYISHPSRPLLLYHILLPDTTFATPSYLKHLRISIRCCLIGSLISNTVTLYGICLDIYIAYHWSFAVVQMTNIFIIYERNYGTFRCNSVLSFVYKPAVRMFELNSE